MIPESDERSESVTEAARAVLARLRALSLDTGDDLTQAEVDDALESLERRLARIAGTAP